MPPFKFRCTSALPSGHQNQFSSTLWTSNINHRPTNCDQSTALDPRTKSLPLRFPSETQTDYNQTMYLTKDTQPNVLKVQSQKSSKKYSSLTEFIQGLTF